MVKLSHLLRLGPALGLGLALGFGTFGATSAQAQSYCPTAAIPQLGGAVKLQRGQCSNNNGGAFSGAALASQTVGDIAGSASSLETNTATSAVAERKNQTSTCQPGEVNVDGICKPRPVAAPAPAVAKPVAGKAPAAVVRRQKVATPGRPEPKAPVRRTERTEITETAPPDILPTHKYGAPQIYDDSFHIGAWAQGFGDFDRRTGKVNDPTFNCCSGNNPNTPLAISVTSQTSSGGFLGGIDFTKRGLNGSQDGFVFGLLGGYDWTRINVNTSIVSSNTSTAKGGNGVANGSSLTNVSINGPSLGAYLTYFNGPFSNEFMLKNDFFSLNQSNSQNLGFGICNCFNGGGAVNLAATGVANSTTLDQFTLSDNITYKIPLGAQTWWAPTAGAKLVESFYGGNAAALGLANGHIFTLQAGAKIGFESFFGDTHMTTTLTGLVFDDVSVAGQSVQNANFGPFGNVLNDQGIVQGQAIAALNFDLGRGLSASVEGDVYGGEGKGQSIFGGGGKVGVRMQW